MSCNLKARIRKYPFLILAFLSVGVLMISACRTDQVDVPDLTGPSGHRLFITMSADPDHLVIKEPGKPRASSRITAQLKDQLGNGVSGENLKFRIANREGAEINIGSLSQLSGTTDSGGFARVTFSSPNTAEQPVPTQIFILSILTNPAYTFEVTGIHALDLESALPGGQECVFGSPNAPVPTFTQTPTAAVVNQEVCFDATGTTDDGQIIAASFSFGDGSIATGLTACHTFRSEGVFVITFTVQDEDRNCASITRTITVGQGGAPTCVFTVSPNPVNTDTTVFFDATGSTDADGSIVSFSWDFGDGSSGSGSEPTHQYGQQGSFTVELTVRDDAGNVTVCTQSVTVASGLPTCSFTITPTSADVNEIVTFNASASTDIDGGTLTFAWDLDNDGSFDDGTASIVTFSYATKGVKIVTLRVTDDEENSVTCSDSVVVGELPPLCAFTISPTAPLPGQTVTFNGSTSSDPDGGTIVSFEWDFGDSCTFPCDTGAVVTHSYTDPDTFVVALTVTDDDGSVVTCSNTVTVSNQAPLCSFTNSAPNSNSPCDATHTNQCVNFSSTSTDPDGGAVTCLWDFGDGFTDTSCSITHLFDAAGPPPGSPAYTVTLTVTDDETPPTNTVCTKSVTISGGAPVADFLRSPQGPVCAGTVIQFDGSASADTDEGALSITNFVWNFGDGTSPQDTGTTDNTSHVYATVSPLAGFPSTLNVTDDEGATDSSSTQSTVVSGSTPTITGAVDTTVNGVCDGTLVITGTDFVGTSTINYNTGADGIFTVNSNTQITDSTPGAGAVTFSVTNACGTSNVFACP